MCKLVRKLFPRAVARGPSPRPTLGVLGGRQEPLAAVAVRCVRIERGVVSDCSQCNQGCMKRLT